jgi:hypothetical protein
MARESIKNSDTNKPIAANTPDFDNWSRQLEEHIEAQHRPDKLSVEENERIFFQTNELLMDIAGSFFSYGKFKDSWDNTKCHAYVFGQSLLLKSQKMDLTFHWGVDRNVFYLESYIIYPENLRYMTDEFWTMLLDLKALGEFEFTGLGSLTVGERPFFENKTSTIFQMIRNFMLFQIDKMNISQFNQPTSMDLGQFILKWDFETGWSNLLEKSSRAFKLLYTLNYQLRKIADLAQKKSLREKS